MQRKSYLYQQYTWPEMAEVVKRQPVVVLPIGSVEDHGPHLPLDTDNFLIWNICEEAARRAEGEILLMPQVPYGYETHHMDFPGTIDIQPEHLLHFMLDITKSVAHHGFERILIADGHGSNMPILDLVARRTNIETGALCGTFIWPSLAPAAVRAVRQSAAGRHGARVRTGNVRLSPRGPRGRADGQGARGDRHAGIRVHLDGPHGGIPGGADGPLDALQQERRERRSHAGHGGKGQSGV